MESSVSIIIPCFNAEKFIEETLVSILSQEGIEMELIVIDDGSEDKTASIIQSFRDERIKYFYQTNKGVSFARNYGLEKIKGEFVIFFDADDIMPPGFIATRLNRLKQTKNVDFISGEVRKFNSAGFIDGSIKGPDSKNLVEQILMYDSDTAACPANIMLRHEFLSKNKIRFNEQLNSTADRFFLLECNSFGICKFFQDVVPLHYRVFDQSMSNLMTPRLVRDNEIYYELLKTSSLIPREIRNISLFLGDFILFGSYWKIGKRTRAMKFGFKCFFRYPVKFIKKLFN